jgi:Flp pilus assembly protein TadD
MDEGRWALVARPATTQLVRTPEAPSTANRILETREVFLSELGPARIVDTTEIHGSFESSLRAYYSEAEQKALRERLEAYVKDQFAAEALTAMEKSGPADLSRPFQLRLEAAKAKVAYTEPDGATVLIQAGGLFDWVPDALKGDLGNAGTPAEKEKGRRKTDLVLPQPYVVEWHYRVVPPAGFKPSELPESAERQLGPALVTEKYSQAPDGSVTGVLRFDTLKRRYTAAEVEAFRAGLKEYLSSPATSVHFEQIGFELLRAGRVKEALETFRALAASHPKAEALHHAQMAHALAEAGLGEAAREEARRAVALEPNSAGAYKTLAWVLSRDLLGREFAKGYDRDGAEAAYRKAKELDPDDKATVGNLAILLEHDPDGTRYGTDAKMDAAIREYESIKDKLAEIQISDNLIIAMLHAGRFKELKEQLKILPPSELRRTILVEAIAAADGSKLAVQEARRLGRSASERSTMLASAAGDLLRLRHYPEAADLLVASSEGSPQAAETAQQAEVFRSIRKHEEVKFTMDRPEDAVLHFWSLAFAGAPEQLLNIQSSLAREKDEARDLKEARAVLTGIRAGLRELNVPLDVTADLALAQIQVKTDGEDAYGYRVRVDMPGTGKGVFYLTKENGQVRLLAMANETGNLGRLVLRICAKDPESARRWLDWAREEATFGGGDDPLAGGAFSRFWSRGQTAADAATLRHAAAALATEADNPEEAGPILLEGRAAAKDETERQKFDLALAQLYAKQEKYAELLPVAQRLTAAAPASSTAFHFLYIALSGLERYSEVESAAAERLRRIPDEVSALRADSMAAAKRGDFAKSDRILKAMIESGKAEASDLNNLAWNQIFEGGSAAEEAVQTAQQGIRLSKTPSGSLLHTLACAYAEAGKSREAHDTLLQTMVAMDLEEPNGLIWYIVGRLAEQYGLSTAAVSAYRMVDEPESKLELPLSTHTLAQRRLKGLGVTTVARSN